MIKQGVKLSDVFRNTRGHIESADIIRSYSTNTNDVRELALKGIDFTGKKRFVDLGCGFGFFTEALKNKIQTGSFISGIDCHEEYRKDYLEVCKNIGITGEFHNSGVQIISTFNPSETDIVLSSYSIYFFPEILPLVVNIVNEKGKVIIITHASTHLRELTDTVLRIIHDKGFKHVNLLPHDRLINNFTAERGESILSGYFGKVEKREFKNELVFSETTVEEFLNYFSYKRSFFMPDGLSGDNKLYHQIEKNLVERFCSKDGCRITKNDAVFICEQPIKRYN
jgi:ubiquinone/menaquinone biosynthesis C-methylase UbiE